MIKGKTCVLGNGCVIDPEVLLQEIDGLGGLFNPTKFFISDRAHVITTVHKKRDAAINQQKSSKDPIDVERVEPPASTRKIR